MINDYPAFIHQKSQLDKMSGFKPISMPDFLFPFQNHLVDWAIRKGRAAIFADCGLGKGQPVGTNILTPSGWKLNSLLKVGDRVIGSNGKAAKVLGIYRKQEQQTFRFWFSDDSSFVVDSDHLHICRTNNDRQRSKPWRVMSTEELLTCENIRYGAGGKSRNYDIPVVKDVEFDTKQKLSIHPYVLGAFLGDGHLSGNLSISSADEEVISRIQKHLPEGVTLKQKSEYDWLVNTGPTGNVRHPFREHFNQMRLLDTRSNTKFIPTHYLWASSKDRLELLRGLMDTDGYIMKCGTSQFCSVSKNLAEGVLHLVRSLGGIPKITSKKTFLYGVRKQDCYIVTFSLATHNPFYLSRKAKRWKENPRDNGRWIDRIEYEGKQKTICLAVDSPDSSYVTEHFIVTHNTPMQLVWADNVVRHTNKPVLILSPLAVSPQTIIEGEKFGIQVERSRDGKFKGDIIITNYERLHYFNPDDFAGVVCDESSAIKHAKAVRRTEITAFMLKRPYRLLCTATAAPNDYIELGTSSEALGYLGFQDMLTSFFKQITSKRDFHAWGRLKYRFRGHAEIPFWRWVCSWARACRKPSDLGYSNEGFDLPPLNEIEHKIGAGAVRKGMFFALPANTLNEQREERRATIQQRCEAVADHVSKIDGPTVSWCHLNAEGDLLEKLIPGAKQAKGAMSIEAKEEILIAFQSGQLQRLVIKPKIGAFGLNWQHCSNITTFVSHSYEQYYQSVRRCWRFGQENPVNVAIFSTEGEVRVLNNLKRKADQMDKMFSALVEQMNDTMKIDRDYKFEKQERLPKWLRK